MKKWIYPLSLIFLFLIIIAVSLPNGAVFGSHTDWLSQHAALAETIRGACLEQHTLLPSWIDLGGGSNGYQFAYYGFLRPDILIGCLMPHIPMAYILMGYMLSVYLLSVLLCYTWLRSENLPPVLAFSGSVLFMTAGCLFHMHRQVMFVNYLPFLLLAFLCIRKKRTNWLPICLCLICLSSFYFAVSAFAAVGWYWYREEKNAFWKNSFLKKYIPSTLAAAGLSAALLIPTALVLLEHSRGGEFTLLSLVTLFCPNVSLNNILFNEYGMGLTVICLYTVLAGLTRHKLRSDSILFLLFGLFGVFSWLLNGTLYARPKILIPFMPLVILHCVRFLHDAGVAARNGRDRRNAAAGSAFPLFPFAVIFPVGLLWFSQEQFPWIMAETGILFFFVLICRRRIHRPLLTRKYKVLTDSYPSAGCLTHPAFVILLLAAPVGMYLTTAGTEDWVDRSEISAGFTSEELEEAAMDPLYHFDSMLSPLDSANELPKSGMTRSTMYSSVTGQAYADFYYNTLLTPIRINNRVALLTSDNPFMLHLLGVRYLETTVDAVPAGWKVIRRLGDNVIAENENVLPSAYFTSDVITQEQFRQLQPLEKLDAVTRKTAADIPENKVSKNRSATVKELESGSAQNPDRAVEDEYIKTYTPIFSETVLPEGLEIRRAGDTYEITADKSSTINLHITNPKPKNILLLSFQLKNETWNAITIDINGIRNKLSGLFAPYPNGNDCFHYQLSTDAEDGITDLSITLSKGHYTISNVQWHLYSQELLAAKSYTPLTLSPQHDTTLSADSRRSCFSSSTVVLSGSILADRDGILATTIPMQAGLEILADGAPAEMITVNETFAGAVLSEGSHQIEIRFSPPGKTAGVLVSLFSASGYVIFLAAGWIRTRKNLSGSDKN